MSRRYFFNISLIITSTLISIVAIDSVARIFFDRYVLVRPTPIYKNRWPADERLTRYDNNVSFSGNIIGDLAVFNHGKDGVSRNVKFITDENGFRNKPEALQRKNDVILVGDSFGAGSSSSQENMLASILEKDFNFRCYNISIGGFGPWHELMTLKYEYENIPKTDNVTIVWLLFTGNDLDGIYHSNFSISPNRLIDRYLIRAKVYFNRSPVRRVLSNLFLSYGHELMNNVLVRKNAGKKILFYKPYIDRANRTLNEVKEQKNYNSFINTLNEVNVFRKKNNVAVVFVSIPSKEEIYKWIIDGKNTWEDNKPSAFGEIIRQVAHQKSFYFLDLKPLFLKKSQKLYQENEKYLYWEDDTHWNDDGQRVAAMAISRIIKDIQKKANPGIYSASPEFSNSESRTGIAEVYR